MKPDSLRSPLPRRRHVLLSCGAALLAACAGRPPSSLLSLPMVEGTAASTSTPPSPGPAAVLIVRRVTLPEYLLSRRVRYRADASTLAEWPDTVWAERIEVAVSRELIAALRPALPGWTVCEPGCAAAGTGARVVSLRIELESMDLVRNLGRLQSRALLTVESPNRPPRQQAISRDLAVAADTPQAHAKAISEFLQGLAQTAAATVKAEPAA